MKSGIATRQKLHKYIDTADDNKIAMLFSYIETEIKNSKKDTYNKWDDAEFVNEMDRRVNALEDGTDKGYTWEEVKERARKSLKAK